MMEQAQVLLVSDPETLRIPISVIEGIDNVYELGWSKGKWIFHDLHPIMAIERKAVTEWDWNKPISLRFAEKEKKANRNLYAALPRHHQQRPKRHQVHEKPCT
jgi:hypothetical protein